MECTKHTSVGLFCVYCGKPVAKINKEDGQLVLVNENGQRKYVAVIYNGKQKKVANVDPGTTKVGIEFAGDGKAERYEPKLSDVIRAFQNTDEVLETKE